MGVGAKASGALGMDLARSNVRSTYNEVKDRSALSGLAHFVERAGINLRTRIKRIRGRA